MKLNIAIAAFGLAGLVGAVHAQDSAQAPTKDPNLARNLAATCANCHGTNGKHNWTAIPLTNSHV